MHKQRYLPMDCECNKERSFDREFDKEKSGNLLVEGMEYCTICQKFRWSTTRHVFNSKSRVYVKMYGVRLSELSVNLHIDLKL